MAAASAFEGRSSYEEALRQGLLAACSTAREMAWLDVDFAPWPLSDTVVLDALAAWARQPGRRLRMLALDYEELRRRHPRFVRWRMLFDHVTEARAVEPEAAGRSPFRAALMAQGGSAPPLTIRLLDDQQWRGVASELPQDSIRVRETFDALAQRSTLSFPSTTFGL
ncbi:hypothetical protein [Pelomonas sp. KK5]|uniref:hypothetical protein n=1 Tax=Pelomonas sp. KK5 TaxID=1855730 RepID=UPI00097C778D|nr:hypothetical protein [Pelomonas sp. KK5]